jgi:hypothetical protein
VKVVVNGNELFVRWKYEDLDVTQQRRVKDAAGKVELKDVKIGTTKKTSCIVSFNGEILHEASVKKYYLDIEDKEESRKQSLRKVLEELYPIKKLHYEGEPAPMQIVDLIRALKKENLPNKKARYEFWKAYMNRKNPDHIL